MLRYLSSMKTGLALMGLIIIYSAVFSFFPGNDPYSACIFRSMLVLLSINLLACSARSFPVLLKRIRCEPVGDKQAENTNDPFRYVHIIKTENTKKSWEQLTRYFSENSFSLKTDVRERILRLCAVRGRLNIAAPFIIHFAVLIIVIGAFVGSFGGKEYIYCFEGEDTVIKPEVAAGYSVELKSFKTVYDEKGETANWQSSFLLKKDGLEAAEGIAEVNTPYKYGDIKIYQSGYGFLHQVTIRKGNEEKKFEFENNQKIEFADNVYISIVKNNMKTVINIYKNDILTDSKELSPEDEVEITEEFFLKYTVTRNYVLLMVKRDPGLPAVMWGLFIISIGFFLLYTKPYKKVLAEIDSENNEVCFSLYCRKKAQQETLYTDLVKAIKGEDVKNE